MEEFSNNHTYKANEKEHNTNKTKTILYFFLAKKWAIEKF